MIHEVSCIEDNGNTLLSFQYGWYGGDGYEFVHENWYIEILMFRLTCLCHIVHILSIFKSFT